MMVIDNKFEIGDIVYLITDKDQIERMVTAIMINPTGLMYRCANGTLDTWQYYIELSTEVNKLKALS